MNKGTTKANGLVTVWTQLTALLHPSALRLTLGCSQPLLTGVENLQLLSGPYLTQSTSSNLPNLFSLKLGQNPLYSSSLNTPFNFLS